MATPPEIATEMVDRFTFAHEVHGTGGFAKVIRGRDTALERDVAVKVLTLLATEFSETEQERFRREARILASLSHPNIPSIYDVSFRAGKAFLIIFQFIEGSNLRGILNEGPCSISEAGSGFIRLHRPWSTPTVYLLCIETLSPQTSLSDLTGNPPISLILELLFPQKTPGNSHSPDGLSEHQAICRPNNKLANPLMLALMSILLESRSMKLSRASLYR